MTTATLLRAPVGGFATGLAGSLAAPGASASAGLVATAASVPPIVLLHLNAPAGLSAERTTISDFVITAHFGVPLFAATAGTLALAAVGLARGWVRAVGGGAVQALLGIWALALVTAAVFPTNPVGTAGTVSSTIHLIAGGVVFAALPAVGMLCWRTLVTRDGHSSGSTTVLVVSAASTLLSAALILNRLPGIVGLDQLMLPPGMLQRAAGAAEIIMLAVLLMTAWRVARRGR
jgi:hypothetical protein